MTCSKLSIPILTLVVVVVAGLLFGSVGRAGKSATQDAEKSLDIERYPNEPLELVDIKISGQSVKDKIKVKNRRDDKGIVTKSWAGRLPATKEAEVISALHGE